MRASFNRTQATAKAPGASRMHRGFYAVLFVLALCAAVVVPSGMAHADDLDQIDVSMPAVVPSHVMADGSIIGPTNWTIENNGTTTARLSGVTATDVYQGLAISATEEGESSPFYAFYNDYTYFKSIDVESGSSVKVNWNFLKLDAKKDSNLIAESIQGAVSVANLSFSFTPFQKQAFAVYSADDNSLDFYKRTEVPSVGDTFNDKTATAVYTGIETAEYTGDPLPPWVDEHAGDIKSAKVVDDGLTPASLACWFATLSNMTSCDLSELDTSKATSMFAMFDECPSLASLDLSSFDTSNVTDMSYMFYNCSSITSLELLDFNTAKVTNMSCMFDECSSLTSLDLSSFATSNVTDMSCMFQGCSSLVSVDASRFDTGKVTNMANMFDHCSSLTSLDLSGTDTASVTNMAQMFYYCPSLTSLNLSGFATSGVTSMRDMFSGCSKLTSLDLSSFDTSNVASMDYMFQGCSELVSLDVSSFDTRNVTDMIDMFRGCESLTALDLSGFDTSNAMSKMSSMFYYCSNLAKVTLGEKWKWASNGLLPAPSDPPIAGADGKWYNSETEQAYAPAEIPSNTAATYVAVKPKPPVAFAVYSDEDNSLNFYKRAEVPNVGDSFNGKKATAVYTGIEASFDSDAPWHEYAEDVKSVKVVDDGLAPESFDCWFDGFRFMSSCDVSMLDTSKATSMECMFRNCSELTSLDLAKFDTSKVTSMEYTFDNCLALTALDLSSFDTASVTDMYGMFEGCSSLDALNLSDFDTASVTDMRIMFQNCSALTTLDLSSFNTANVTAMNAMFFGCSELTSLDLSSFNTANLQSTALMFSGLNKLETVQLGANWTWVGSNGYLPAPSSESIAGADGNWYDSETGVAYAPADIPNKTAATYVAVKPPVAFAVYSADDNSLNFYKRSEVPSATDNDKFEGKTASAVYTGIETVSSYSAPWHQYASRIRSVAFVDDGIAPQYLNSWFRDFGVMKSCDISKLDTSKAASMYHMFDGCKSLTSLDVSRFDTAEVTDMESMFCNCNLLTLLDVSKFNTSNVTYMLYMFDGCYSLTSLDVSGFDTAKVTDMQYMFDGCSALTSLNVSGFDTKNVGSMDPWYNVGSMDSMFRDCKSLTSLDLSNFDTAKVANMQFMFTGCLSLTSLDLSSFDMSKVTEAAGTQSMFHTCPKLSTVKLGKGWKWVGSNGYLPAPSSESITGADGYWYDSQTGVAYAPADIPSNTAATYVAVKPKELLSNTPDALSASRTLRDTTAASTQAPDSSRQVAVAPANETGASTEDEPGAAADDAKAVDASGRQAASSKSDGDPTSD